MHLPVWQRHTLSGNNACILPTPCSHCMLPSAACCTWLKDRHKPYQLTLKHTNTHTQRCSVDVSDAKAVVGLYILDQIPIFDGVSSTVASRCALLCCYIIRTGALLLVCSACIDIWFSPILNNILNYFSCTSFVFTDRSYTMRGDTNTHRHSPTRCARRDTACISITCQTE